MDILNHLGEVAFVANVTIPILAVPDGGAGRQSGDWRSRNTPVAVSAFIANLASGELLPRSHDLRNGPSVNWLEKDMDVIRHDDPGQQPVTLRIKGQQ